MPCQQIIGKRSEFQVPEPFLRSMGKKVEPGEHDNIFRSVFDSWRQEIDRTINGFRKDFKITEDTTILLCGSAGDILYIDDFIEGSLGLNTEYLNPIRNLSLPPDFDLKSIKIQPHNFDCLNRVGFTNKSLRECFTKKSKTTRDVSMG